MSLVSTFGTYSIAKLGLYAASKALEVTGNNITNVQTDGYTRQSLDQESLHMASADRYATANVLHMGTGVLVPSVSQSRDIYRSAADAARSTLECSLHNIEKLIEQKEPTGRTGVHARGGLFTDYRT
jgi:flagellar hook-associated protein 1 FlgK